MGTAQHKPYEAECYSEHHGEKHCDHKDFECLQYAHNWLSGCHGYSKAIEHRQADGTTYVIWEDGMVVEPRRIPQGRIA